MYAVLHLAEFALQAVLRTEPGTAGQPAALFSDQTRKSLVLVANAPARAAGVISGMTAPQAVARSPHLIIRTPSPTAEADARAALLAVGFTLSPLVEDTAPGICTVDLKGSVPAQYGPASRAAVAQLAEFGLTTTVGIAPTPLLALYAARAAGHRAAAAATAAPRASAGPEQLTLLSLRPEDEADAPAPAAPGERAARIEDAAGTYDAAAPVLHVTDATTFLGPLPLAAADPPPEMASILHSWGLRTVGDLAALSRDDIGRRLGPAGLALWDRARGGAARPLHPVALPETFGAAREFEEEVETLEPLLFILRRFLERITLELRTHGFVAAELALTLTLADDSRHERSFRLPEPTADLEILFRTLHTHLESLHTDSAVIGLRLDATPARPLVRQQGLFDTGLRDPHGFAETLARIVAIVGSDRVGTPVMEDTHRPDAVKLEPPSPIVPPLAAPPVHPPAGLPLRRFRPPLRAQLELTDGRPTYLWTERFNGAVTQLRGPWLNSGGWWQNDRSWRRVEYDVALATGGLYRMVLTEQQWLVEGEYD
ncbi:DNA polymerase Y family protein [Opitutus sp. ER46]|uniref:DNA polymerase Y family protein n=1 Tax=Opitutus sp. ER46 TaxID=2161864 RepID=UPI000D2F4EAA|nr:DNA polymerase Y family protein [Opitutus sp. ER46]PTX90943.1 hypothetical protein DB354_20040 [Opitutus sp. ER46]